MADNQAIDVLKDQINESNDWLKFVLGEYFKWYAAFLALNVAALGFTEKFSNTCLIGSAFTFIDLVGAMLAVCVWYWARRVQVNIAMSRSELLKFTVLDPKHGAQYPTLPTVFGLMAAVVTQIVLAYVWWIIIPC